MKTKRKPTSQDPLKRLTVMTPRRLSGMKGLQDDGTYVKNDGTTNRKKTIWLEDGFARRWAAWCAQRHLEESTFAQQAIAAEMERREREG